MSEHKTQIRWTRTSADFTYDTYNRTHTLTFERGFSMPVSGAPEFKGEAQHANPEELLVAALSSCHMLSFLAIAARKRIAVKAYADDAVGVMTKNDKGKLFVSHVTLSPKIEFDEGKTPDRQVLEDMHHLAHAECFIANSVITHVEVKV